MMKKNKNRNKKAKFFCESCGAEVSKDARFCTNCGKFFSSVRCPNCGVTGTTDEFKHGCPACGYAVNNSSGALYQTKNIKAKQPLKAFNKRGFGTLALNLKSYQASSDSLPLWIYVVVISVLIAVIICLYSCLK